MVDRPPPSQFAVVERGGRLVVIDRKSGATPPTAAERMAEHDRRRGQVAIRPTLPEPLSEIIVEPAPPPRTVAAPPPGETKAAVPAAVDAGRGKQPWGSNVRDAPRANADRPPLARLTERPRLQNKADRHRIVTGKWWDAKGPRTIELGQKGRAELTGGFILLFLVAVAAAIILTLISPLLALATAFLFFRFGGKLLGPIGASIVDKALAKRG